MKKINQYLTYQFPLFFLHHPILKDSTIAKKLRVVFNGSCISSNNSSLNNILLKGPVLQPDILINFKNYKNKTSDDTEKIYIQVLVSEA